jgi:hypothetical protein
MWECFAKFLQDVEDEEGTVVFRKDKFYKALEGENVIYVRVEGTKEAVEFPKTVEGEVFVLHDERG